MLNFWLWIYGKTIKTHGFYDSAYLHICSICVRLDVSSVTEIQYLQNEPSGKGTHTNKSIMLKMFCVHRFVRWTKCIWWAIKNTYLLVWKLFEFAVEWIPAIKNKAEINLLFKTLFAFLQLLIRKLAFACSLCIWGIMPLVCCSN